MTNLQHLEFMLRAGQTDGLARKAETVSNLAQLTTLEVKWRIGFFGVRADSVPRSLKQAA
ncbi:hypothetical protein [Thalassococcus lentus]|uniref:Uncharacterized protein n=1 Tax=Thalassococcus lentus TaxID=1210524 RepID=A0ABT4XS02_9RHOB|nr:hypothetical protein [Thalassococcus lentus]MDA7424732.1 hypothetical protein [Thalassococcus lentus]